MLPAPVRGALTALQRHRALVRNHETAVQRAPHRCEVDLQPCNPLRIYARSICSRVTPSAPVRGHFAALQQQIAGMRGEITKTQQGIAQKQQT